MISFILNDRKYTTELPPGAVTLDLLRSEAGMTGTREGCREGDCGACTVLLGIPTQQGTKYMAVNSCILPVGELRGRHLVTIEGVNPKEGLSPIQQIIVEEGASQCGFCTPGLIMSLTGYLLGTVDPDDVEAVGSVAGNICRCTGYVSIKKAAETVSVKIGHSPAECCYSRKHLEWLVEKEILPSYFLEIELMLQAMNDGESNGFEVNTSEHAVTVAGGTDLFAVKTEELRNTELRFLSRETGMNGIDILENKVLLGARATVRDIIDSGIFSNSGNLERSLELIASAQVRNRATVGGNIINASPIGDLIIIFLALDARLSITGGSDQREVQLKDFFSGYKVFDLSPGELLKSLEYTAPDSSTLINFEKVAMRKHLDIASVNSAAAFRINSGKIEKADISAGGVAPIPLYLEKTSAVLTGMEVSTDTAQLAVRTACCEVSPIDDVRGSAEYKKLLLGKLIAAHFVELFPQQIDVEDLL
ncbi:MAG: FAD binding domain-containing protein [Candidatus Aegiribacteria sp.]|nr:FAD binding domain-containing protein [Candidatus Aegiribacteria sp.]